MDDPTTTPASPAASPPSAQPSPAAVQDPTDLGGCAAPAESSQPNAAAQAGPSDALADHLWGRRCALIYKIRLSIAYHLCRAQFLDRFDKVCSMLAGFFASGVVATTVSQQSEIGIVLAVATAILSLIPLVYNPAASSREHAQAAVDFRKLLAACLRAGQHWSAAQCDDFDAQAVEIEVAEPASLAILVIHCENQLKADSGEDYVPLGRWVKFWMHLVPMDAAAVIARRRNKEAQDREKAAKAAAASQAAAPAAPPVQPAAAPSTALPSAPANP